MVQGGKGRGERRGRRELPASIYHVSGPGLCDSCKHRLTNNRSLRTMGSSFAGHSIATSKMRRKVPDEHYSRHLTQGLEGCLQKSWFWQHSKTLSQDIKDHCTDKARPIYPSIHPEEESDTKDHHEGETLALPETHRDACLERRPIMR